MFDKTWKWAGHFRKSNKNIGSDWPMINEHLKILLDDTEYHIHNSIYPIQEIAVRFHHRLVSIHGFVNGNGRHVRLITDILLTSLEHDKFSWGLNKSDNPLIIPEKYIRALRAADSKDYNPLLDFLSDK